MRLQTLELTDFRNIARTQLILDGPRNFFVGTNGQGKTNLLEAIGLAARLASFRTHKREPMIATGKPQAVVRGVWSHETRGQTTLAVAITPARATALLDGVAIKSASEVMGIFPVVTLSLADRELVYGGPAARRDEIDHIICQIDPSYFGTLSDYEKAIKSRNALLTQTPPAPASQFDAFESVMETTARRIIKSRARAVELLGPIFQKAFASFAPASEIPSLAYEPNCPDSELRARWLERRTTKDAALGYTSSGPHRDHFTLTLNGEAAELYASEGQKFSIVLALKLAGLQLLQDKLGIAPVLVCDDLLLELDGARQANFWRSVADLQVFASGTTAPAAPEGAPAWKIWRVTDGSFALEG